MFKRGFVAIHGALFALTIAAAVAIPTGTASADVSQTPVTTGCPAGYDHLSITWLRTQGPYLAVGMVDGNGNGWICGQAWSDAAYAAHCRSGCPVPVLYILKDDDSPALQP